MVYSLLRRLAVLARSETSDMIYVITGHLGSGKSLLAVRIAHDYLKAGRRVASNITLCLDKLPGDDMSKVSATKLPYIPTAAHLSELGNGYDGKYDEDKFGLIILDEAGTWLNSRDWNDKDRRGLFQWLTHARKFGWDLALLVQDFEAMDAQIRRSIVEIFVKCQRLDRVKIPYLPIKLPKYFVGTGRYGGPDGLKYKTWHASAEDYFESYLTTEKVRMETVWTDQGAEVDARGSYSMLSAWHLRGRYRQARPPLSGYVGFAVKWTLFFILAGLLWPLTRSGRGHLGWRENFRADLAGVFPKTARTPYDLAKSTD